MIRIQKIVSSREYTEFRDLVILLESSFAQITKNGDGIQQVQLAITPKELIIASYEIPAKIVELEDNYNDEVLQLVSIIPLECVQISIYSRRHNKLKIRFCNGSVKYYELSERENACALWRCWCDRIQFLSSDSNLSSLSESSLLDYLRNSQNTMTGMCTSRRQERPSAGSDHKNEIINQKNNSITKRSDILSKIHSLLDEDQKNCPEDVGIPVKKDLICSLIGMTGSIREKIEAPKKPVFHSVPRFASGVSERCKNRLSLGEFSYPQRKKNTTEFESKYRTESNPSNTHWKLNTGVQEKNASFENNNPSESLKFYSRWSKRGISGSDAKTQKGACKNEDTNLCPTTTMCKSNKEFVEFLIKQICPSEKKPFQEAVEKKLPVITTETKKKSSTKVINIPPDSCLNWVKKNRKKKSLSRIELDESYFEWLCNRRARHIEYACNVSQLRKKMQLWKEERDNSIFGELQKEALELADKIILKWENCTLGRLIPKGEYIVPYGTVLAGLIELQGKNGKLSRIRKVRSEVHLFDYTDKMCYLRKEYLSRGVFLHSISLPNIRLEEKQADSSCLFKCDSFGRGDFLEDKEEINFWFLPLDLNFGYQDIMQKQCHYHRKLAYLRQLLKFHEKSSHMEKLTESEKEVEKDKIQLETMKSEKGTGEDECKWNCQSSFTCTSDLPCTTSDTAFSSPCYQSGNPEDKYVKSPSLMSAFLHKTSDLIQRSLDSLRSPEKINVIKTSKCPRIRAGELEKYFLSSGNKHSVERLSELSLRVLESQQEPAIYPKSSSPASFCDSVVLGSSNREEHTPITVRTVKQPIPANVCCEFDIHQAEGKPKETEEEKWICLVPPVSTLNEDLESLYYKQKIPISPRTSLALKQVVPTHIWCDYVTQQVEGKRKQIKEKTDVCIVPPINLVSVGTSTEDLQTLNNLQRIPISKSSPLITKQIIPTRVWCDYVTQRAEQRQRRKKEKTLVPPCISVEDLPVTSMDYEYGKKIPLITKQTVPAHIWCDYKTQLAEERQRRKKEKKFVPPCISMEDLSVTSMDYESGKKTPLITKQTVPANIWCDYKTQLAEERQRRKKEKKFVPPCISVEDLSVTSMDYESGKKTPLITKQTVPTHVWCDYKTQLAEERQKQRDELRAKKKCDKLEKKMLKKSRTILKQEKKDIKKFSKEKQKYTQAATACFLLPLGSLMEFHPEAVARELTLIDREFLFQVGNAELDYFVHRQYSVEDFAPHIKAMVVWYDRILSLTISEILKEKNAIEQSKIIIKCIQIIDHMMILQSFNSSHAILMGLQSIQAGNLKQSWEIVYSRCGEEYKKFYQIIKDNMMGKTFRIISTYAAKRPSPPYLPFFGELLQASLGLLHVEKSNEDFHKMTPDKATYPAPKRNLEVLAENCRKEQVTPFLLYFENPKFFCCKHKVDLTKASAIQARKRMTSISYPPQDLFHLWKTMRNAASEYSFKSNPEIRSYLLFEPYQHLTQLI